MSRSGLVTVTGGKWTTYRAMAEDVLDKCAQKGLIIRTRRGLTKELPLVGSSRSKVAGRPLCEAPGWHSYGSEQGLHQTLPGADHELCPGLT